MSKLTKFFVGEIALRIRIRGQDILINKLINDNCKLQEKCNKLIEEAKIEREAMKVYEEIQQMNYITKRRQINGKAICRVPTR